jgi:hypothetical protein
LTPDEIAKKIKESGFPPKFELIEALNSLEFKNVHNNSTTSENFESQLNKYSSFLNYNPN